MFGIFVSNRILSKRNVSVSVANEICEGSCAASARHFGCVLGTEQIDRKKYLLLATSHSLCLRVTWRGAFLPPEGPF